MRNNFKAGLLAGLIALSPCGFAAAQTVGILPNAMSQFIDGNGAPYAGGKVYFYIPGTTTLKNTWQDGGQVTLNANPVTLDANGRATIFGSGQYREVLQDQFGNTIWDLLTAGVNPSALNSWSPGTLAGNPGASIGSLVPITIGTGLNLSSGGTLSNTFSFPTTTVAGSIVESKTGAPFNSPVFDVMAYGAVIGASGANATINNVSVQNAITDAATGGGQVHFPCGVFEVTNLLTASIASGANLDIEGSGAECTVLYSSGAIDGLSATYGNQFSSLTVRNLTFATDHNGAQTGLNLALSNGLSNEYAPGNVIEGVNFRGWDFNSTGNNYWGTGFRSTGPSNINFIGGSCNMNPSGALARGTCYSIAGYGSGTNPYAVVFNFFGTAMNMANIGLNYGNWVQGVTLNAVNMTGCNYGVSTGTGNSSSVDVLDELSLVNTQLNTNIDGILINAQYFNNLQVTNSTIITSGGTGISVQGTGYSITNNVFGAVSNSGTIGVNLVTSFGNSGTVGQNQFAGYGTAVNVPATQAGVPKVQFNKFTNNTNDYVVNAGSTGDTQIDDNQGRNFATLPGCANNLRYSRAYIVDNTGTTMFMNAAGGGAVNVMILCTGSNWQVH